MKASCAEESSVSEKLRRNADSREMQTLTKQNWLEIELTGKGVYKLRLRKTNVLESEPLFPLLPRVQTGDVLQRIFQLYLVFVLPSPYKNHYKNSQFRLTSRPHILDAPALTPNTAMYTSTILAIILLGMVISTITVIQSHLLIPICSLQFLSSTNFCGAVRSVGGLTATYPSKISEPRGGSQSYYRATVAKLCVLPVISSLEFCAEAGYATTHSLHPSGLILHQFESLKGLVDTSSATPKLMYDIREIVMALEDLIVLVRNSKMKYRDSIVAELESIKAAGKQSSRRLQSYATRLNSAVTM